MIDNAIDPLTGDYIYVNGSLQRDPANGLRNAVYLSLNTALGSYWADPTLGSRLHELQREKDLARIETLAQQYANDALKSLLEDGRIQALNISSTRQAGRLLLLLEITAANGQLFTVQHPVKVMG